MLQNNMNRIRRRKLERDAALKDCHALASELGLTLIDVEGVRPEVFYDAVVLLQSIRDCLPPNTDAITVGVSPDTGVCITAVNVT